MKKSLVAMFGLGALAVFFVTAMADQPGEKDKGPKKGPPGEKKGWEPGKIIPPFVRDALDLTEDQAKKIDELEKEVRAKLLKILTEEQLQRARELKGPKGPPKGKNGDGPPDKKGKGKDKDKDRDRFNSDVVRFEFPRRARPVIVQDDRFVS